MNENLFENQNQLTTQNKMLAFCKSNKILIYSLIAMLLIIISSTSIYLEINERKKILLSDNFMDAKVYLQKGEKEKARDTLKSVIFEDNSTYSALSLFLILEEDLIEDKKELLKLFNYILENNRYEKELKNLIIYKKALFQSNFVDEQQLLQTLKPLLNNETFWKPHALLLLGDYFVFKKENIKATEFYSRILTLKNINNDLYEQARSQLILIKND